jgi:hypothetical protein
MTRTTLERAITRRSALSGGAACALALFAPRTLFGAQAPQDSPALMSSGFAGTSISLNLYAFVGATPDTTAIAVTWQRQTTAVDHHRRRVRIHAGLKSWMFDVSNLASAKPQRSDDISLFMGEIVSPSGSNEEPLAAVVLEVPNRAIGRDGSAGIWAEYDITGVRKRLGTPFLSNLVAGDERLSAIYHSSSPAEDRNILINPLAMKISQRLQAAGCISNPDSHGQRLAAALLPDVLRYDPDRPNGFTFAARNGRHPLEPTEQVVNVILNGGVPSASPVSSARHFNDTFPYFQQMASAV